jgi:hypothetical protein
VTVGGTAGTPLVGVGAASASRSHHSETPHLGSSSRHGPRTKSKPSSPHRESQTPDPKRAEGTAPNGSGRADTPALTLKKHAFRIGTWNMCSQTSSLDGKRYSKTIYAEDIMFLEKVDLLILTETHAESLSVSNKSTILAQTGISTSRAGVSIIAPNNGGWSSDSTCVLVLGYAVITRVSHSVSRESFWLLAVYGNMNAVTTGSHESLLSFYSELLTALTDFILDQDHFGLWNSCVAARDWNFVEHDTDRNPPRVPLQTNKLIRQAFKDIKMLCLFADCAGQKAYPRCNETRPYLCFSPIFTVFIGTHIAFLCYHMIRHYGICSFVVT